MKVWIVTHDIVYEGSTIQGVYATEQLAALAAEHPYAPLTVSEHDVIAPADVPRDARRPDDG